MTLEELDRLYADPANRPLGTFYKCAADPRVIAPSRPDWRGWQINFAHPRALPTLVLYLGILGVPLGLVFLLGPANPLPMALLAGGVFLASVVFLVLLCTHLSRQHATEPAGLR